MITLTEEKATSSIHKAINRHILILLQNDLYFLIIQFLPYYFSTIFYICSVSVVQYQKQAQHSLY